MKLWQKNKSLNKAVESFTVGKDHILDMELLPYDCKASKAHARMLQKTGFLSDEETAQLISGLDEILALVEKDDFIIRIEDEDGHTAIENFLTQKYGDAGKKIHTGRSRNDQVLTALRLYSMDRLEEISEELLAAIIAVEKFIHLRGHTVIPGYTHTRKAMPSSVGMWSAAFQAAFSDDLDILKAARRLINQNPLGTGAGYGVPLPLDRSMTAKELGFAKVLDNPIYAQNSRGKFEGFVLSALSQIMLDINKLAADLIFFTMPGLDYFSLPDEFLTGSSIMPQKKNPDVLELLRAKYHELLGYELQVRNTTVNLISGYHRDIQITKEAVIRGFETSVEAIRITTLVFQHLMVNEDKCAEAMTDELYATEKVYQLVQQGLSFRDAYRIVGKEYETPEQDNE